MNKKEHSKEPHPRLAEGRGAPSHAHRSDASLPEGSEDAADTGRVKSAIDIAMERAAAVAQGKEVVISQEDLAVLRAEAAKAGEHWNRLLRTQADLENYRKRVARERQELSQFANESLLRDLLTPLDHFEMGLKVSTQAPANDPLREGMQMVLEQFRQFLKTHGLTEIEAAGQPFDPAQHEAVAQQESDAPEGQVIQEVRKGYRLHTKVLRAATVIVSKGHAPPIAPDGEPPAPSATAEPTTEAGADQATD